jgi:hypothetical protein
MKKPTKEKFGWVDSVGFVYEGGREAYEAAIKRWQFMQDNGLGEEDMINDITYPHEL